MKNGGWRQNLGSAAATLAMVLLVGACSATAASPAVGSSAARSPAILASAPAGVMGSVQLKVGSDLCSLLTAADFTAAGVPGAGQVSKNSLEPTAFYCVYTGKSGATGGIEFDAFISEPADLAGTFTEVAPQGPAVEDVAQAIPGADKAVVALEMPGIAVQTGNLIFGIWFPASANARSSLIALSTLVITRAAASTS